MEFSEGVEEAAGYARQVHDLLAKHGIPATPQNYTVWYAYVAGRYPDLAAALDGYIDRDSSFSESDNAEIYDKFFTHHEEEEALRDASERMEEHLASVMSVINTATGETRHFQDSIRDGLQDLTKSMGLEGIKQVMARLVTEAKRMQESNETLQQRLETSSEEVSSLRRHLEEVQREALTDGLTGIPNRKMFDMSLRRLTREAVERNEPLCLALTDIDFFKAFNDNYGHQTGDQVLKLVARILADNVDGHEVAARYGGEEFVLILPKCRLPDAMALSEHIRQTVSSKKIRNKNSGKDLGNITMSIGVSQYRPGEPMSELIQRADAALYYAKGNGRNQTALETSLESASAVG